MPSLSPTEESKRFSPDLSTIEEKHEPLRPEEATKTETENSSVFFSRPVIAAAFVGVALAVTAYFAPPVAIAATLALAVTGLVYYAVTAMFDFSQASTPAPEGPEAQSSTPDADNDVQTTNSYGKVNQSLPVVDETKEETKSEQLGTTSPTSEHEALLSESEKEPVVTGERSDSLDSQNSTLSNNM